MEYIHIEGTRYNIKVEQIDGKYHYLLRHNNEEPTNIGVSIKPPLEIGKMSEIGKSIFTPLKDKEYSARNDDERNRKREKDFRDILKRLDKGIKEDSLREKHEQELAEKENTEKYIQLYSNFITNRDAHGYTTLQYLGQICQGVGVGVADTVLKVYVGLLLTILGIKATNIIAIGKQSSGKTHSLERGIEMIPEEYVVRGVHTKAYFFTKFNKQDVSRKIFYLGDLGGTKDDMNTIDTRDILKELNTDGYVERGLSIEGEAINEWVKGYPAIVYSTVEEDIINDQEKSRSTIINPASVDPDCLTVFNAVHESPGEDIHLLERIQADIESVRGLTWYLMGQIQNYELFNPYMFNVSEFLAEMDDFNRKIKEFNKTLFIVALLNNPFILEHEIYVDEETYEQKKTKLIIASKQDVLNALVIFDGANNLLPTETALLKGLNKMYREFDIGLGEDIPVSEYEKKIQEYGKDNLFKVKDDGSIIGWDTQFVEEEDGYHYYFFTVSSIRRAYGSQLWYRNVKSSLPSKLRKLYENKYLIKIGKTTNSNTGTVENVYGLIPNLGDKIENNRPVFGGERLKKGKEEFKRKYPHLYDEFEEFIDKDRMKRCSKVDFEVNESTLYNVPWNIKF